MSDGEVAACSSNPGSQVKKANGGKLEEDSHNWEFGVEGVPENFERGIWNHLCMEDIESVRSNQMVTVQALNVLIYDVNFNENRLLNAPYHSSAHSSFYQDFLRSKKNNMLFKKEDVKNYFFFAHEKNQCWLVPVLDNNHYFLLIGTRNGKTFQIFEVDPIFRVKNSSVFRELFSLIDQQFSNAEYTVVKEDQLPKQQDSISCGVLLLSSLKIFCKLATVKFNKYIDQYDIEKCRYELANRLFNISKDSFDIQRPLEYTEREYDTTPLVKNKTSSKKTKMLIFKV